MQTGRGRGSHPVSLIQEVRAGPAFAALTSDADLLVPGDLTLRTTPVNLQPLPCRKCETPAPAAGLRGWLIWGF